MLRTSFLIVALATYTSLADAQTVSKPAPKGNDKPEPTHVAVQYGPHKRNVMDVWLAPSDKPTPVLFNIHGGAFQTGSKEVGVGLLQLCLKEGISVVAISYRLSSEAIAPAQFHDAARAVQFVRQHSKEWNIDPKRFAASGASAGAGISLWLAFHDDLADPKSDDPVLRESSRLSCAATLFGQTTYDPRVLKKMYPDSKAYRADWAEKFYGVKLDKLDGLPEEKYRLFEEVSPINHLTKDDPPVIQIYGVTVDSPPTDAIHHARFGKLLKDKMDPLGIECKIVETMARNENVVFEFVRDHLKPR